MQSKSIHEFYKALGAQALDSGVSGTGSFKFFQKKDIEIAIKKIKTLSINEEDKKEYIKFLETCLKADSCVIDFS